MSSSDRSVRAETPGPDGDLLSRIIENDADALSALYDRYSPYVYALALRMLGNREEADEVTQDVFWQLWKHKVDYDPARGRFTTWLFAVTRNRCIDRIRRERRKPPTISVDHETRTSGSNPEEAAYLVEARRHVAKAMSELPDDQQRAVELCLYDGMTHREVAAHLKEPLGTIKSRIRMGMTKLRQHLSSWSIRDA